MAEANGDVAHDGAVEAHDHDGAVEAHDHDGASKLPWS